MSTLINQLNRDIYQYNNIKKKSKSYIKYKNLQKKHFKVNRNVIRIVDLPIEYILGTIYLIKGNNIICFYSYIDPTYSARIEINIKINTWLCRIEVVNVEGGDPENLNELIKYYDLIRDSEYLGLIILDYIINKGFDLYINK